jgi:hypothetical protein
MTGPDEPGENDPELDRLLMRWTAPVVPEGMDERILRARRRHFGGRAWRRFLSSSIRVPLPVAVALALIFALTAMLALRPARPLPSAAAPQGPAPAQAAQAAESPLVTGTSLAGFQPEPELRATVVVGINP